MLNGDGLRAVLWVSGCSHKCKGCHNPVTWDKNEGLLFDKSAEDELFEIIAKPYISGVTFSGGDPLYPDNRQEIARLTAKVSENFPDKTIWIYTGFMWEEIKDLDFIKYADVLVDGEFVESLKENTLHWKGSCNQRVIDVKKSLSENSVILHST